MKKLYVYLLMLIYIVWMDECDIIRERGDETSPIDGIYDIYIQKIMRRLIYNLKCYNVWNKENL